MLPPKSVIKPGPEVCADEGEGQSLKLYASPMPERQIRFFRTSREQRKVQKIESKGCRHEA